MLFTALKTVLIILEVLLIFNLMIIVHELGHFLAGRWRGLVIEKFGIWFGKPIWKKTIGGVEYSLGSIPAGGFVSLPQLAPMEVMEGKVETPREQLPPISALDKIIVAFAGPLFSFGLAFVFALIVWQAGRPVGEPESTQVIGAVREKSPAAEAGIQPGDKVIAIDGHRVNRFQGMGADCIMWRVVRSEGEVIVMDIERDGKPLTVYPRPRIPAKKHWWNRKGLREIGVLPAMSAIVAEVKADSPASRAGLQKGDLIVAINGRPLYGPEDMYEFAAAHSTEALTLTVKREGTEVSLSFDPQGIKVVAVEKESPAGAAGLQKGDVILGMDDQKAMVVEQLIDYVGSRAGVPITFHLRRDGAALDLKVTPQIPLTSPETDQKAKIGFIPEEDDGLAFQPGGNTRVIHPAPLEQLRAGVMGIVNTLDAVVLGKSGISVQHMGGPVMMMNAYYTMLSSPEGLRMALWFSVVLNVNLALLNLLPIPVLDGGHITLAIVEAIRRKPVNVRFLEFIQTGCALVIIGFMVFIAFFDVQDLPFFGSKAPGVKFQKSTPAETTK
jgi:regulator of sigma E protease